MLTEREGGSERERERRERESERERAREREREKRKGTEGLVKGGKPRIEWFAPDPFYL